MTALAELMVLPVLSENKKAKFAAETGWMFHRMDAFERSRARVGTTMERVALVETPFGDFSISHLEGTKTYGTVASEIRDSAETFDIDMMNRGKVLHGLDEDGQRHKRVALGLKIDFAELAQTRLPWFSFAAAVPQGATDDWLQMAEALSSTRSEEFAEMNRDSGIVVFRASVYHADGGDLGIYYLEGSEDADFLPNLLRRGGEFVDWLASTLEAAHGHDFRDGIPSPLVGKPWDWVLGGPNPVVAPLYNEVVEYFAK